LILSLIDIGSSTHPCIRRFVHLVCETRYL